MESSWIYSKKNIQLLSQIQHWKIFPFPKQHLYRVNDFKAFAIVLFFSTLPRGHTHNAICIDGLTCLSARIIYNTFHFMQWNWQWPNQRDYINNIDVQSVSSKVHQMQRIFSCVHFRTHRLLFSPFFHAREWEKKSKWNE